MRKISLLISLFFALAVQAQNWTVNPSSYSYNMTAYVVIGVEGRGATLDAKRYELAAFVGNECRGISTVGSKNGYIWRQLTLYSNVESGETVRFYCYDAWTGEVTVFDETVSFVSASLVGLPSAPFRMGVFPEGDLWVDGQLNIRDVQLLSQLVVGSLQPSELDSHARIPDFNKDGNTSIYDLVHFIENLK